MKSIKNFILEGKGPEKISEINKKRLSKYIDDCIAHMNDIYDYAGIRTDDDAELADENCEMLVWDYVVDNGMLNNDTGDDESIDFVTHEYERLSQAVRDAYNLK